MRVNKRKVDLSYGRERLKRGFSAGAFIFGLLIDWTFEGRVKGWIGTSLQLLLPFVLAFLMSLVVHEAYNDGRDEGKRTAELKHSGEN